MNIQESLNDKKALVIELADKHDEISHYREKLRKCVDEKKEIEAKVVLRNNIITEMRHQKIKVGTEKKHFDNFFYYS